MSEERCNVCGYIMRNKENIVVCIKCNTKNHSLCCVMIYNAKKDRNEFMCDKCRGVVFSK